MSRVTLFACALLWGAACTGEGSDPRVLSVYAASSLTDAFRDLESAFEEANPGTDVSLTFAGSQVLRLQIEHGALADVFASADPDHVRALSSAGRLGESRAFAHNELALIVPLDNPAGIESMHDLARAERLVIGAPTVPVGRYTREALRRAAASFGPQFEAAVLASVVSEENNVRLVRAKVELGEADAAIVYRTDAVASDRVRLVPLPLDINTRAQYLIGVVEGGPNPAGAAAWLRFLRSSEALQIMVGHGFTAE